MTANKQLLVLPGDGIGPEVMGEVERVIDWLDAKRQVTFSVEKRLVGGAAYDAEGAPVSDATVAQAKAADAVARQYQQLLVRGHVQGAPLLGRMRSPLLHRGRGRGPAQRGG